MPLLKTKLTIIINIIDNDIQVLGAFNKVLILLQVIIKKYEMKYNKPVLYKNYYKIRHRHKKWKKKIAKKDRFSVWYLKRLRRVLRMLENHVISHTFWVFTSLREELFGALWRRGGKRKESSQLRLWNLTSTSSSPVASRRLSCQISSNQREAETSANVNIHWKTRAKGNFISANQNFASTFSMQTLRLKRRSCKRFFLFPPRRQSALESLLAG